MQICKLGGVIIVKLIISGEGIQFESEISFDEAVKLVKRYYGKEPLQAMRRFWVKLTEPQKIYCRITYEGWISSSSLRSEFGERGHRNMHPTAIAGIRRGLNIKARKLLGEDIDEQVWIDADGENKYRIKTKFKADLSSLL